MSADISRRDFVETLTAAAFTTLQLTAAESGAPLFFSKAQFALLDYLAEMIIPADDHSPGAHAAGVAAFIDRTVAEAFDPEEKASWPKGLTIIENLSREQHGKSFLQAAPNQQRAILEAIAKNEQNPQTDAERFWGQLKETTAFAYYTTSIAIHQEMNYKGNVILEQFVGYDAT